jgi:hypothetical protein
VVAAELDEFFESFGKSCFVWRYDTELESREFLVGSSEVEVDYFERAAALDDAVHNPREDLRIYKVPFGFDNLGMWHKKVLSAECWVLSAKKKC